jgi:outer membrane usher protein
MPLDVVINNTAGGQWVLLERNGVLYAPEEAFVAWRLSHRPDAPVVEYRGQKWIPLNAVPGYESKYNYADQSVELTFSPQAFEATHLDKEAAIRPQLTPTVPAAFLNYDISYTGSAFRDAPGDRQLGALTELGLSASGGVLTSSFVGQNLTGSSQTQPSIWRRLETTYTRDYLDSDTTLKVGDSTTRRGTWGRPIYFGGVQVGSNFGLTPGFISQPIPIITGTSSAPSTVQLYVNDVLRQTSTVPTGPFTIDNFPLLTSSGDAHMVVRDALGRETVIDQPFFTHPNLLERNLTDWSMEAGAARQNLGTSNFDYGQRFISGMMRHGMSKSLTIETQGELGQTTRDAGIGVDYALPFRALGQLALSTSQDQTAGSGTDWALGIQKADLRHHYSATLERATLNYRQIGLGPGVLPYKTQLSGNYSYTPEANSGSLALGVARIATYDQGTLTTYSGNYSTYVRKNAALTFSLARVVGSTPGFALGVSLLIPMDTQTNFTSSVTHRNGGQTDGYVSASKNLTNDNGIGWRALTGARAGYDYGEGGLYYQGDRGLLTTDVSASSLQQTLRLGAQGGLVMMDGHAFMTRRVQDSFALVEVPGYADVGVDFQNSTWTHTDKDGVALLPRLLPYQSNSIRLDPTELPINAELDSIEQVVVPAARSGVKVVFPVRSGRGALIHVKLENGDNAPAGAIVTLDGDKEEFYVARHGDVFVTGMHDKNTLHLKLDNTGCTFEVSLPPENPNDITRIGPVTCAANPERAKQTDNKGSTR